MGEVSRAARVGLVLLLFAGAAGCAVGSPSTFALSSASVDNTYVCPAGASNAPYNLHATIGVRNGTTTSVTIKSVAAVLTLAAVKGSWLEKVGDKYEATGAAFSPASVGAGSSTSLQVAIPSACTKGTIPSTATSYGEYSVGLSVTTSSGTYKIKSENRHRIVAD